MHSFIAFKFQSLTRDSNHSNYQITTDPTPILRFNPSRGIAIIQTQDKEIERTIRSAVSIPHAG